MQINIDYALRTDTALTETSKYGNGIVNEGQVGKYSTEEYSTDMDIKDDSLENS